jgi:hypothetical protein
MSQFITLKFPLENGTKGLTLRRPKVRDMLASEKAKGSDGEKEVVLFANLCEVTPEEIGALDMIDYKQLQEAYQNFLS